MSRAAEPAPVFHEQMSDAAIAPLPRVSIQAFCETADIAELVEAAARDRRLDKTQVKTHMGGAPAAVEAFRAASTPNVLILQAASDPSALLDDLDQLAQSCDPTTKVVVVGRTNDVLLYRELIRRGVSEYLMAPFGVVDLIRALSGLFGVPGAEPLGRTIAVVGTKGGVGSSTIAHNLGWSAASGFGVATVIADLDLGFGTLGLDFDQDPAQGIAEAVFSPERVDANLVDRLLAKCSDNLSLLAAPAMLDRVYDFQETSFDPVLEILRATTPCIVLDIPHLWTSWARRTLISADEIVIVASPDLVSFRNVKSLMTVFRQGRPNDRLPKLVINMVGVPKRPELPVADFAKVLDLEPSAIIPFDAMLFGTALNNGRMLAEIQPTHKINEIITALTADVLGRTAIKKGKSNPFGALLGSLKRRKA